MGEGQFERRSTHQRRRRGRAMRGIVDPRRAGQGRVELPCLQLDTGGQDTGPCPERDGPGARSGWRCKPGERHRNNINCYLFSVLRKGSVLLFTLGPGG